MSIVRQIAADRGLDIEAQVLTAIKASPEGTAGITLKDVTDKFITIYGGEYDDKVTSRWIGTLIRRKLGLSTRKSHGVYVIPLEEAPRLNALYMKYGTEEAPPKDGELPTIAA